jgi:hypothetical protein
MARSDKAALLISEWLLAAIFVTMVWFGVQYFGYVGAGVAFAAQYLLHVLLIAWIVKARHEFVLDKSTRKVILVGISFVVIAFGATYITSPIWRHVSGVLLLFMAMVWSLHGLVVRLGYERVMNGLQKFVGRSVRLKFDWALSKFYR